VCKVCVSNSLLVNYLVFVGFFFVIYFNYTIIAFSCIIIWWCDEVVYFCADFVDFSLRRQACLRFSLKRHFISLYISIYLLLSTPIFSTLSIWFMVVLWLGNRDLEKLDPRKKWIFLENNKHTHTHSHCGRPVLAKLL
jgi:hypothetical protein